MLESKSRKTNKRHTLFYVVISFVCLVPVRLLPSSMAVFVPREWLAANLKNLQSEFVYSLPKHLYGPACPVDEMDDENRWQINKTKILTLNKIKFLLGLLL